MAKSVSPGHPMGYGSGLGFALTQTHIIIRTTKRTPIISHMVVGYLWVSCGPISFKGSA